MGWYTDPVLVVSQGLRSATCDYGVILIYSVPGRAYSQISLLPAYLPCLLGVLGSPRFLVLGVAGRARHSQGAIATRRAAQRTKAILYPQIK